MDSKKDNLNQRMLNGNDGKGCALGIKVANMRNNLKLEYIVSNNYRLCSTYRLSQKFNVEERDISGSQFFVINRGIRYLTI